MKHAVQHQTALLPASKSRDPLTEKTEQAKMTHFIVALGMRAGDLGYRHVLHAISKLGEVAHFNEGLLRLTTTLTIDQAFKRINKSIIDPRIPSDVGLMILDTQQSHAKWYLNREVSEVLISEWHNRTNLFVCHNDCANRQLVYDINALGPAIPISEHIWYVSTSYLPGEAYKILSASRKADDRLTVFDAAGNISSWQSEQNSMLVQVAGVTNLLPTRATILQSKSWQASMLAEFL